MSYWSTTLSTIILLLTTAVSAAAETVTMPYVCRTDGPRPILLPTSSPRTYSVVGQHEARRLTQCSGGGNRDCQTFQLHRFDIVCGGDRIDWMSIATAALRLNRRQAWIEGGRMYFAPAARLPAGCDGPACAARHARSSESYRFPPGYAPLGLTGAKLSGAKPKDAESSTLPAVAPDLPLPKPTRVPAIAKPKDVSELPPPAAGPPVPKVEAPATQPTSRAHTQVAGGAELHPAVGGGSAKPPREPLITRGEPTAPQPDPAGRQHGTPAEPSAAEPPPEHQTVSLTAAGREGVESAPRASAANGSGERQAGGLSRQANDEPTTGPKPQAAASKPVEVAGLQPAWLVTVVGGDGAAAAGGQRTAPSPLGMLLLATLVLSSLTLIMVGRARARMASPRKERHRSRAAADADGPPPPIVNLPVGPSGYMLDELQETIQQLVAANDVVLARLDDAPPLQGVLRQEIDLVRHRLSIDVRPDGKPLDDRQRKQRLQTGIRELYRVLKIAEGATASFAHTGIQAGQPQSREAAYDLLGVNAEVDPAVIKKVVDALRVSWHPDHARDEPDRQRREERTKQINVAWDLIRRKPAAT